MYIIYLQEERPIAHRVFHQVTSGFTAAEFSPLTKALISNVFFYDIGYFYKYFI